MMRITFVNSDKLEVIKRIRKFNRISKKYDKLYRKRNAYLKEHGFNLYGILGDCNTIYADAKTIEEIEEYNDQLYALECVSSSLRKKINELI